MAGNRDELRHGNQLSGMVDLPEGYEADPLSEDHKVGRCTVQLIIRVVSGRRSDTQGDVLAPEIQGHERAGVEAPDDDRIRVNVSLKGHVLDPEPQGVVHIAAHGTLGEALFDSDA